MLVAALQGNTWQYWMEIALIIYQEPFNISRVRVGIWKQSQRTAIWYRYNHQQKTTIQHATCPKSWAHHPSWTLDQHLISWICISKSTRSLIWASHRTRFHCIHSSYWNRKKPISSNSSRNIVNILKVVLRQRQDSSLTSWSLELRKTYMHREPMRRTSNSNHMYWLKKMTPTTPVRLITKEAKLTKDFNVCRSQHQRWCVKMMALPLNIMKLTIVKITIKEDMQIYLKMQHKTIPRRMSSKLNMDLMS